ncbi:MAG: hypothetical protein M3P51_16860, partial [Chloroflexota bacterium]|nr:hypothetical protein [Chloroflexota bacterium]
GGVSPSRQLRPVRLLLALFVSAAMLVFAVPAQAQEEAAPTMVKARVVTEMSQDGNNSVEAMYTVEGTDGLEDGVVEHLLVRQPGAEIGEISVENGSSDEAELSEGEGISRYRVPVSGDPATYTLRYEVRTDPQTFTVPIAVPDVAVAQPADSDIEIETLLPEGERLTGEVFPSTSSMETRDGRQVLLQRVNNVPSRVIAQYGEGSVFGISNFTSALAVAAFGVVLFFWYRRTFGGRSR